MRAWYVVVGALLVVALAAEGRKFYDDDPLAREPAPIAVKQAKSRKISDIYDIFSHILATPGTRPLPGKPVRARDINTLGEVMEGPWYEKRHGRTRMSIAELTAGPGNATPPAQGTWTILSAKSEGITPGFLVEDSAKRRYFIKFDPPGNAEMATAADVISSKVFHALGYHVPQNYIVTFDRARLELGSGVQFRDARGELRELTRRDMSEILNKVERNSDGQMRATASLLVEGKPLGPFRYYGTRSDDPNDTIPHEHRRSLRGLHVFCAWVGHDDSRSINSLDTLVQGSGVPHIRHYLIDFGSTLGSASTKPNSPRSGHEQFFTWASAAKEFLTFGVYVPRWSFIEYGNYPSVGRFSAAEFDPRKWTPEYPNPAFDNRLEEDNFWAADQVMRFTDAEIKAMVGTGRYWDISAEAHVAAVLIARRDAIGRAYLSQPNSLTDIRIDGGRVVFNDWSAKLGQSGSQLNYRYSWAELDNDSGKTSPLPQTTAAIPSTNNGRYLALEIRAEGNERRVVRIYLKRASASGYHIVGIERVFQSS